MLKTKTNSTNKAALDESMANQIGEGIAAMCQTDILLWVLSFDHIQLEQQCDELCTVAKTYRRDTVRNSWCIHERRLEALHDPPGKETQLEIESSLQEEPYGFPS